AADAIGRGVNTVRIGERNLVLLIKHGRGALALDGEPGAFERQNGVRRLVEGTLDRTAWLLKAAHPDRRHEQAEQKDRRLGFSHGGPPSMDSCFVKRLSPSALVSLCRSDSHASNTRA